MIPGKTYKPEDFLRAAWRRRTMIAIPIVLSAIGSAIWSYTQPNEYRSETTLLVVSPSSAGSLVAGAGVVPVEDRLYEIRQQVVSHAGLQELVQSAGLYPEWREAHPNGDVAERMRKDVDISIVKGNPRRDDGTFFSISYVSTDAQTAATVTNRLADLFLHQNAADRENAARTTATFIDTQLAEARGKLEEQEKAIDAYRERNAVELPSTLQANLDSVRRQQAQLDNVIASLSADRAQRITLQSNIAAAQLPAPQGSAAGRRPGDLANASVGTQLDAARNDLRLLELHLTEAHPDVLQAKRKIQELEERARAEGMPQSAEGGVLSPAEVDRRERLQQLRSQMSGLELQIADKEQSLPRLRQSIDMYQARVDAAPRHEAELAALSRDLTTLDGVYQKLLAGRENAGIATKLEAEQNGRFKVIEPAKVPAAPFRPDRAQWMLLGALFGLGLGLGLAALLEFMDSTLRSDADIATALGLPVLAMIPIMHTSKELTSRRQLRLAVSAMVAMLMVASVFVLVW